MRIADANHLGVAASTVMPPVFSPHSVLQQVHNTTNVLPIVNRQFPPSVNTVVEAPAAGTGRLTVAKRARNQKLIVSHEE